MKSIKEMDDLQKQIGEFIVNNLGINLCSVESIDVDRQSDGQIKYINIKFIPDPME